MSLFFVGSINSPSSSNAGVAGQIAQLGLIAGLKSEGLEHVISYSPVSCFPKCPKIFFKHEKHKEDGVTFTYLPFINIPLFKWISINLSLLFYLLLLTKKNDHILSYNYSYPSGWPIYILKLFRKVRMGVIVFDINIPGETVNKNFFNYFNLYSYKYLLPKVDKLIAITPNIVKDFRKSGSSIVLHGGVNKVYEPSYFTNTEQLTVGYAGGLDDFNGIKILINSVLKQKGKFHLNIMGKGPLLAYVQEVANTSSFITYHGSLPHDDALRILLSCDILACLRLTKTISTDYLFPSKYLEYLSLGKLVICTPLNVTDSKDLHKRSLVIESESEGAVDEILNKVLLMTDSEIKLKHTSAQAYIRFHLWDRQTIRIINYIYGEKIDIS